MKRISILLIAFTVCLIAQAQITNKIWNLTLGKSSKQQVRSAIAAHRLKIREQGVDYITCSPTKFHFGGETWDYAKFRFYKGQLYLVSFSYNAVISVKENFDRLKKSLEEKYSQYLRDYDLDTYGDYFIDFDDNKTTVSLTYNIEHGNDFVGIMYYSDEMMLQRHKHSKSEL